MRIVHVVTLVSADGAYGGPVAVARGQSEALAKRGHEVKLVAGWDGAAVLDVAGVDVRLHRARAVMPGTGFAGLSSPSLWKDAAELARSADLVHVHLARDLVTLPAAWLATRCSPVCIQTHGMIRQDKRVKARALDAILTRRVIRSAALQLVLTKAEEEDAPRVARCHVDTIRIANGVTLPSFQAAWDGVSTPEVIYCARLHARKRPVTFVEMAGVLLQRGVNARFTLMGPDEGELPAVHSAIQHLGVRDHVKYEGALPPADVLHRLAKAQVYVLPSVNEPFPMSLLEAMSVGLPSVLTDSTGISEPLKHAGAAHVTTSDSNRLADSVADVIGSVASWASWSERARTEIEENYLAASVATQLEEAYGHVVGGAR